MGCQAILLPKKTVKLHPSWGRKKSRIPSRCHWIPNPHCGLKGINFKRLPSEGIDLWEAWDAHRAFWRAVSLGATTFQHLFLSPWSTYSIVTWILFTQMLVTMHSSKLPPSETNKGTRSGWLRLVYRHFVLLSWSPRYHLWYKYGESWWTIETKHIETTENILKVTEQLKRKWSILKLGP